MKEQAKLRKDKEPEGTAFRNIFMLRTFITAFDDAELIGFVRIFYIKIKIVP